MKTIAAIVLVMTLLLPVNVTAQEELTDPGITPDSPFYILDRAYEKVQLAFAKDEISRAQLNIEFASERMAEARNMADKGKPEYIPALVADYEENLNRSQKIAETAQRLGEDVSDVDELVAMATSIHIDILEQLLEKVPEQARPAIRNAINHSEMEQEECLNRLGNVEPERAAEICLRIAERHMNRLRERLEAGDMQQAEDLIEKYNHRAEMSINMIEKARQMGRNVTDIEENVMAATSTHREVLSNVSELVSEEAQEAIEKALNVSVTGQQQALAALNTSLPPHADRASAGKQENGIPETARSEKPERPGGRP